MRKAKSKDQQRQQRLRRSVGTFDRLEDRCLLAPIPIFGTAYNTLANFGPGVTGFDGFVSVRLISTQTGRIEADPNGAFGGDLFVVSRGSPATAGGIITAPTNPGDVPGNIYRVDPYGANAFGASPANNRQLFATIPSGGVSFGGFENWHDLTFDVTENFRVVNGGPTLYVSTLDSATTPGINPRNAIYGFRPDGTLVTPVTVTNPTGVAAFSDVDAVHPGVLDSQIGAIAIAPGDTFARNLYVFDVACDNEVGITCAAGDGNTIFGVTTGDVTASSPGPVNLDAPFVPLNGHVEGILPPLTPVPPNNDIDVRAMVFDPNRGIILQGQYGEPAFQLFGGLYVASSDVEAADTAQTRLLQFPSPGAPPVDLIPPAPVTTRMIGDMAFDPVGFFGGGIFFTDYITGSVFEVNQDPETGQGVFFQWATNFNVLTPTQFLPTDPPGITPAQAYRDAFSITFSANGEIMYVSDRDGVWAFYAGTYNHSASGAYTGSADVRELRAPYTGKGFAAAVIDTGIDASHLGFQGVVLPGFTPEFPGTANIDANGHGTAVGGIIHQIAPDAVLLPLGLNFGARQNFSTAQALYDDIRFIADNPFVDDPRTPGRDSIPIVALNMSIGISLPAHVVDSEADAFHEDQSVVIPLKGVLSRYQAGVVTPYGIAAVSSAGNFGQEWNGMSGNGLPAILNDIVSTMAAYPYGPTPPFAAPPITLGSPAAATRCTLEAGDNIAFPGKIAAFSNRNIVDNFAAPGTCVSTYSPSFLAIGNGNTIPIAQGFVTGPILSDFNGTSAAAPNVAGSFVFGFDTVSFWSAVAAAGGLISPIDSPFTTADDKMAKLNQYLTRALLAPSGFEIAPTTLVIGDAADHLTPYLNRDGIHAILQWTAVPHEDVNIGEDLFSNPTGDDDDVIQRHQCSLDSCGDYYNYSHLNIANFMSAVEGSIALNYFNERPVELAQLAAAAGGPSIITTADIDCYIDAGTPAFDPFNCIPATLNTPTERAMAHLLGGADKIGRINRMNFLDIVQDEHVDGGIFIDATAYQNLRTRILPGPRDFVITDRFASANERYALDSTAVRNIHDLIGMPRSGVLAPKIRGKLANKSPGQITFGSHGQAQLFIEPVPGRPIAVPRLSPWRVVGRGAVIPGPGGGQVPPGGGGGGQQGGGGATTTPATSVNNFFALSEAGIEYVYHTNSDGDLLEYSRAADGAWIVTNVTAATGGPSVYSDLIAIDLDGGSSRAVYGLTADGHVARYEFAGGTWTTDDVTATSGLPPINSSLTSVVLKRPTGDTTVLYGLNSAGELIEYRSGRLGWTARNISTITRGAPLSSKLAAWGEIYRGKIERIFVFGTTADGHAIQYLQSGKRWSQFDLSNTGPIVTADSVVVLPPANVGGVPSLFGLDGQGSLWRYTGNLRLGWESVAGNVGGPALTGELGTQYAAGSGTMVVFGVDREGRMVQYSGQPGNWSWSVIGSAGPAPTGDVSASANYRSVYSELVDGALAEFWLGDTWNVRRLDPDATTPGAGDGSTATSQLIALALATR